VKIYGKTNFLITLQPHTFQYLSETCFKYISAQPNPEAAVRFCKTVNDVNNLWRPHSLMTGLVYLYD